MSNHSSAAARLPARVLAALEPTDDSAVGKLVTAALSGSSNPRPSLAEIRSRQSGLAVLSRDLAEAGLGDVEMLVEFKLPFTSKRVDVILAGSDPSTGQDTYVIVELKQWRRAELYEDDPNLVVVPTENNQPKLHPAVQVLGYRDYLTDFISTLEHHRERVHGVVYLYKACDEDIKDLYGNVQNERVRLFSKTRREAFLNYLQKRFAPLHGTESADRLLSSAVRPSKQLIKTSTEEIRHREQFVLIAEQRLPYEIVLNALDKSHAAGSKEVVIVTGGPGSGKSAIALSLLGELLRRGHHVVHATGSRSLTETMRRVPGKGSSKVKNLFKYFNSFAHAEPNGLDVLICDEAHRIRETSQNRYTPARLRSDRLQIDELIDAARVPVFFLDEHQVIRPGEMGTTAAIRGRAAARGFRVHEVSLDEQFRYGGSRAYDEWVLRLLGLHDDPPKPWMGDDHFDVSLAASPHELEALLRVKHDQGYSARVTAGFCWPWSDPREDDTLVRDVRIGDWSRPWTVKGDRAVGEAPASALWATQEGGFGQVGSVYTAQGFEYDWNGVIIGPDLVYRDGRLVTVRSASKDPALTKGTTAEQADRFVRNTYKVLLTRGLTGTVLYSTDSETQGFLAKLLPPASG
ncbi:DUF2075 domain-containing protein [Streptosporangium sp. NPDC000239]|uniref:DUF2075 domain-containing protein n=1 Tax=Streptosporangium sp. NPDC000239 TaxID=3154248 RepID=UPI003330A92E